MSGSAVPLGSLGDRFGHRRVWVLLTVLQAAVFASYPLVRSFQVFVTLVILAAIAEVGTAPIRGAYLSRIAGPELRVRARAYSPARLQRRVRDRRAGRRCGAECGHDSGLRDASAVRRGLFRYLRGGPADAPRGRANPPRRGHLAVQGSAAIFAT